MILANIKYLFLGNIQLIQNVELSRVPSINEYIYLYDLPVTLQVVKISHVTTASGYKDKGYPTCVLSCILES